MLQYSAFIPLLLLLLLSFLLLPNFILPSPLLPLNFILPSPFLLNFFLPSPHLFKFIPPSPPLLNFVLPSPPLPFNFISILLLVLSFSLHPFFSSFSFQSLFLHMHNNNFVIISNNFQKHKWEN